MKKKLFFPLFAVAFAALLFASPGLAQIWYPANQKTVAWDAPTLDAGGTPLPAGITLAYKTYYKTSVGGAPVFLAEVTTTQAVFTFSTQGSYFVGVSAIQKDGAVVIVESVIAWSDNAASCQGGATFGIRSYAVPGSPKNLRSSSLFGNFYYMLPYTEIIVDG